jgi:hypothetical protein
LVRRRKDRAANEALEIGAFGDERVKLGQRLSDRLGLAIVLGEGEEGGSIAAGDAGNECFVLCQSPSPHAGVEYASATPVRRRQPQEFVMIPLR